MRNHRVRLLILLIGFSIAAITLLSQSPAAQKASFEVASVKEHAFAPGPMGSDFQPGGRFVATMMPLQELITSAYDIAPAQLQFAPDLPDAPLKTMYDIEAKAPPGTIPSGRLSHDNQRIMASMLQTLLADRFKLKMHVEKRELPIYALLVEKSGLKLPKAPARDCSVRPSPCHWTRVGSGSGAHGQGVTLKGLAEEIGYFSDRSIIDKTGIESMFDIDLPPFVRGAPTPGTLVDGVPVDINAPSLATVLHEVGLRLEPQNQVMDVYIVDHVEKPTAN